MNSVQSLLEQIGYNHHESAVYLQLLQSGEQPASVVARATKLPRSTVRGVLDKLCTRGVVTKLYKRNTQFFRCEKPSALVSDLHNRLVEDQANVARMTAALPQLEAMHRSDSIVPKVKYYEGDKGVIEAFNHSLFVDGIEEILFFTSYTFIRIPVIIANDDDFYIPLRVKKAIRMRVLVGVDEALDPRRKYNDPAELRERRYIPEGHLLPGNIHVYGNFVVYFSANENEKMAVLIESAMMADTMRALFEFVWKQCKTSR